MNEKRKNIAHFEREIIEPHSIERCCDCKYFKEYGAPYQDGNTCQAPGIECPQVTHFDIPDWCPFLATSI